MVLSYQLKVCKGYQGEVFDHRAIRLQREEDYTQVLL